MIPQIRRGKIVQPLMLAAMMVGIAGCTHSSHATPPPQTLAPTGPPAAAPSNPGSGSAGASSVVVGGHHAQEEFDISCEQLGQNIVLGLNAVDENSGPVVGADAVLSPDGTVQSVEISALTTEADNMWGVDDNPTSLGNSATTTRAGDRFTISGVGNNLTDTDPDNTKTQTFTIVFDCPTVTSAPGL